MQVNLKLDKFEGPFDLLYHLIEKSEIDIYDIPIAEITDQYMEYIQNMELLDMDVASEFLLMAATLLEIKSKMLLPVPPKELQDDGEYSIDPREELIQKLIEYKKYKEASIELGDKLAINMRAMYKVPEPMEQYYGDYFDLPDMEVSLLFESFNKVIQRVIEKERVSSLRHHIAPDESTIEDKQAYILDLLKKEKSFVLDIIFLECNTKMEAIVTFLAALELVKIGKILVKQEITFASILIEGVE